MLLFLGTFWRKKNVSLKMLVARKSCKENTDHCLKGLKMGVQKSYKF